MGALVSIVLPTYNGSRYIRSSIHSVLNQDDSRWELIIVNDGSTDETPSICREFAANDQRIKVMTNPRNINLPRSLNRGFMAAQGERWTWTSDDNILDPAFLSSFVRQFQIDPSTDLAYSDYHHIDESGCDLGPAPVCAKRLDELFTTNTIGASFMYSSSLAKRVGACDPRLFLIEDWDYWIRCYKHGIIRKIDAVHYYHRVHSASLSGTIAAHSPGNKRKTKHDYACVRLLAKNLKVFPPRSEQRGGIRKTLLCLINERWTGSPYVVHALAPLGLLHLLQSREGSLLQFILIKDMRRLWAARIRPALKSLLRLRRRQMPRD